MGYWADTEMKLTLANPGCFVSGIIQHELTHMLMMHMNLFSNGEPTIVPTEEGVIIGQRDGLSKTDIAEIRAYYGC